MAMSCKLGYEHDPKTRETTAKCVQECTIYKKGPKDSCIKADEVKCGLVTKVTFKGGEFKPETKAKIVDNEGRVVEEIVLRSVPECRCYAVSAKCTYIPIEKEGKPKELKSADCIPTDCPSYFTDDKCLNPARTACHMVIDHSDNSKIKCVCLIVT
jgi:hypothetical protein